MQLTPTLWRTCRVLANPTRLACLHAVMQQPQATVQDVAQRARVAAPVASLYLRHLQARGLVRPERVSRWVRYTAAAEESVAHAAPVLNAIGVALHAEAPPYPAARRSLTAFTHPRRIAILRAVPARSPVTFETLRAATGISVPALHRHLAKLERHGVLTSRDQAWVLSPHPSPLTTTLLDESRRAAPPATPPSARRPQP